MFDMDYMKQLAELSGFSLSETELTRLDNDMRDIISLMDEIKPFSETDIIANDAVPYKLRPDDVTSPSLPTVCYKIHSIGGSE